MKPRVFKVVVKHDQNSEIRFAEAFLVELYQGHRSSVSLKKCGSDFMGKVFMPYAVTALIVGSFLATSIVVVSPIFLFFMLSPFAAIPFSVGAAFAYMLGRRGWFECLSSRWKVLLPIILLPAAIVVPVFVSYTVLAFVNYGELFPSSPKIDLPPGSVVIDKNIGPNVGYIGLETKDSFDTLKAYFLESHGIEIDLWRDTPTLNPNDDPKTIGQSTLPYSFNDYEFVLNRCGERSCVTVGWRFENEPRYDLIALTALNVVVALLLLAMIVFGPPKRMRQ